MSPNSNDKNYFIKKGYKHRRSYSHYDDTGLEDQYQDKVYEVALDVMKRNSLRSVYDIGCGSGFKLIKYFKDYNFIGSEIQSTLDWLVEKYPNHNWEQSNFEKRVNTDLFICSDVIEHLVDPDKLLDFLENSEFKFAVISTPERDAVQMYQRGYTWDGPPQNRSHTREWSYSEFYNYLNNRFEIVDHFMTKNKAERISLCQMVILKKVI